MKTFRTAILIAGILVAGLAYSSVAQTIDNDKPRRFSVKKEKVRNHESKVHKHELKENKHEWKRQHQMKREMKSEHKAGAHAFKHEVKKDAKAFKAEAKVHKAKIRPHDKMKSRKYKEKI
jgi:hypothetical protein